MTDPWLGWARRVAALAQSGLHYAEGQYDRERYTELQRIAADMLAALAGAPPEPVHRLLVPERGYATPKLDVRAAVFDGAGRLLLVRERADGGWTMPGGWADVGDSPTETAVREVREEAGLETRVSGLLGIYERDRWGHDPLPFAIWKVVLRADVVGGVAAPGPETDGVGFFAPGEVGTPGGAPLSTTRLTAALLDRVFAHADRTLPPDLD